MSKIMTTGEMGSGALSRSEKAAHPLGNYWKALVPIVVGVALLFLPIPGRAHAQCLVLLRVVRGGDHRFDTRTDSSSCGGIDRCDGRYSGITGYTQARRRYQVGPLRISGRHCLVDLRRFHVCTGLREDRSGAARGAESGEMARQEDAWPRLCRGVGGSRPRAVYAVEHRAQRRHDLPGDQEYSTALWLGA